MHKVKIEIERMQPTKAAQNFEYLITAGRFNWKKFKYVMTHGMKNDINGVTNRKPQIERK